MTQSQRNPIHQHDASQHQYTPAGQAIQSPPVIMRKRIGSTIYRVRVHFSDTGTETMNDKILRLVKNEVSE
jgi:hypothetical protein